MVKREMVVEEVQRIMKSIARVRNIGIVAHVDHGKTTLSDSLIARAGLISKELAGEQRVLDYDKIEQEKGITIKAANISLSFNFNGTDYLINLIDTPGHVDFGMHVTRAMRAVDGIILVVDAVEGIMPQTETVLRQALKEMAKPILFINKIDRLINELKLSSGQMQERLVKIINGVNKLIETYAPKEFAKEWMIRVDKGNVAFGSAFHKWAVSARSMERFKIGFKDIYDKCTMEEHAFLVERSPIDDVILEMVITHLPDPKTAQAYRIPVLWKGDLSSEEGKEMLECNREKEVIGVCFGIAHDAHAGEVAVVRLFSGELKKGDDVYLSSKKSFYKIQQLGIYMGPDRVMTDGISSGNIGAIVGFKDLYIGDTISSRPINPFEQIRHYSEPVITKAIEVKDSKNLTKLIEVLREIAKEDPTLKVEINQETGEHLISGMGEVHLEIVETKIKDEKKVEIITSLPIIVYRESILAKGGPFEGKSPNKHNRFKVAVEQLEKTVCDAIGEGTIPEERPKGKSGVENFIEAGLSRDEAKNVWDVYGRNIFINGTKGIQYLNEVQELLIKGFEEAMENGPIAKEKCSGIKVILTDAMIHEDAVHRGPAQVLPAIKRPLYAGMLQAGVVLLEPKQKYFIQTPHEYASNVITLVNGKRGELISVEAEENISSITAKLPVAETIGISSELRSVTQGRVLWYTEYAGFEVVPSSLQSTVVKKIRERKGEKPEPPKVNDFLD